MPNITIEKVSESILVDFGDYAAEPNPVKKLKGDVERSYDIHDLSMISRRTDCVYIYMDVTHEEWLITHDQTYSGNEFMIVDSIDQGAGEGPIQPTTLQELFDQISGLRG